MDAGGRLPGWIGTRIAWELEPADEGGTIVRFTRGGWNDKQAEGEMARCACTWAMIIDRLSQQVAGGSRAPYFRAGAPLPR